VTTSTPVTGLVRFGREVCGDLEAAVRREWLVTNGLGGYASGTLAGIATRVHHGLLTAATTPPVGRMVLVGGLVEWATVDGVRRPLHAHEYADGTIDQHGYRHLESFALDGSLPVWTYAFGDTRLEKRLWMPHGRNTTVLRYELMGGDRDVILELTPLVTCRDHHATGHEADGAPTVEGLWDTALRIRPRSGPIFRLLASGGAVEPGGAWYRGFRHRAETARGLPDLSDLYAPGTFRMTIRPGHHGALVLSAGSDAIDSVAEVDDALDRARRRQVELVERASAKSPFVRQLVLAADQFLVEREIPVVEGRLERGRSVIAGYPWFNDWGRDTMIALPGLCLATGRTDEAATILRSFARFVRDGLLPNDFPSRALEEPAYNTADASLWYPLALRAYEEATGDSALVDELQPTMLAIVDAHVAGTRFGIAVDAEDGLLRAGADGVALTWMDARVEDWVVTPRRGKPVEIQALWVNALRIVAAWLAERGGRSDAGALVELADTASASFRSRFWRPELGWLADLIDGPDGDDPALRPNQLLAVSLPHPLVDGHVARAVVRACGQALLTSLGLRSLDPAHPAYRERFEGDRRTRDGAYHQGAVWSWLIGPYAEAVWRVTGDREAALDVLRPFVDHLRDAGLGSISEVFEPEPPHEPRGCVAQAWGVSELLRTWRLIADE
jgi:predicted glycogen debranching enzyme